MRQDSFDDLFRVTLVAQDRRAVLRMLVERRMHLVVEVVQQSDGAPQFLVLTEIPRVPPHARLDAERMTEQWLALRVLRECLPGAFACDLHGVGRLPRCRRRP